MRYQNPILPGFYPDPSVCRVDDNFYLVTSTFEYFPGVPVFHSRDLIHWHQIGHCLTRQEQLPLAGAQCSGGIYAPTIRWHKGRFYMITTNTSSGGNFFVYTDDPAGEWSDPVKVDLPGIDPSLLFDDDGKVYVTVSDSLQAELDIHTGKLCTEPQKLWGGTGGQWPEAPHLYKINGYYYLMLAEGGTEFGHMVTIARSASPWGPWHVCPHNPILSHRSLASPIQATGHADLIQDRHGAWWMVFLAIRPMGYPPVHHLGRETFLAPVRWEDGWPIVGNNGQVALEMEAPLSPGRAGQPVSGRENFDTVALPLHWNWLRNPQAGDWSLRERPGWLRLRGSAVSLDDAGSPAWVGRRQQHFACRVKTELSFEPVCDNEEAGLCVMMNNNHHYEIALTLRNNKPAVIVRRRIGSLVAETACVEAGPGNIILGIDADEKWYFFRLYHQGRESTLLAAGETRYLASEVAGGFTGVYLAMYTTGNGRLCKNPADFKWFEYTGPI